MTKVICDGWSPAKAMDVVRIIRDLGYAQGIDFAFEYHPPIFDSYSYDQEPKQDRYVVFSFYKEEIATWFAIKFK